MEEQIIKFIHTIFGIDEGVCHYSKSDEGTECSYSYSISRRTITITVRSQTDHHDIYLYNEYTYSMDFVLDLVECFDRCGK